MKKRGIIGILLLCLILITATACGSDDKETTSQQSAEDDIKFTITADGNIEASLQMELTFGSGGKVDKIHVKEGDKVNKGDVLAELDTSALELTVTQVNIARVKAEIDVDQAQASVNQTQVGITQAQVNLENAEIALELTRTTYSVSDIQVAEAGVDVAQRNLDEALWTFSKFDPETPGYDNYQKVILQAEAGLKAAENTLDSMLAGFDVREVTSKKLQVEAARQSLELAEQTLEIAEQSLGLAEQALELAWQSADYAQKQLDEATITAPFDGTVYKVGAKEGEFLSPAAFAGRTIVGIIDLSHMELIVKVEEFDIAKVKTGQKVMITVDAVPEAKIEGRVTFISSVASEPDGVVLFENDDEVEKYEVKIDFDIPEDLPLRAGMSTTAEIIVE